MHTNQYTQVRTIVGVAAAILSLAAATAIAETQPVADAPVFVDDPAARGQTPEQHQGYAIASRADRTDFGFGDSVVEVTMILKNAAGQESSRRLTFKTLEKVSEQVGDKSLVIFQSPKDVEGTALLSHANILEPDDQWLFLPALKRVKRISSANKSGPFVGSEFAFEDFTLTELNKFSYKYIGEETFNEMTVDVVDRFPRYERSGYARQRVLIDQDIYQARKLEFFDRKGDLLKTLILSDYREYNGIWRAHHFSMINHQSDKSTDLIYEEFSFKSGMSERDFEKGVLARLR